MTQVEHEIDTALAQEKLQRTLDALHSTPVIIGFNSEILAMRAELNALRGLFSSANLLTEAAICNAIADSVIDQMQNMVDSGILDEEALTFLDDENEEDMDEV